MLKGYYRIAGKAVEINSIYSDIHKMSHDYQIPDCKPDIKITINQDDITCERSKVLEEGYKFTDGYLETLSVHRKLATSLIQSDTLLFHGSAVAVDGQVYVFTAKSGTGKSTHARLWRKKFGERAVMVNDDKPMLKVYNDGVSVCGTPWNGKHRLDTNVELPLKAICIIRRDNDNHIERISVEEALPVLWEQSYRPSDEMDMGKMMELFGHIAENIPIYRLGCNMEDEAADVAWEGMKNP
jgi:hypothetical protein